MPTVGAIAPPAPHEIRLRTQYELLMNSRLTSCELWMKSRTFLDEISFSSPITGDY